MHYYTGCTVRTVEADKVMKTLVMLMLVAAAALTIHAQNTRNRNKNNSRRRRDPCTSNKPPRPQTDHLWTDPRDGKERSYILSWDVGCNKFTQRQARAYCSKLGMVPISLDSNKKAEHFKNLLGHVKSIYFWTGGVVNHRLQTVFWNNENASPVKFGDSGQWSHTGGLKRRQPDNRDKKGENCLGVLQNVYKDGIKWHDVQCGHTKPTICEPKN